MIKNRPTLFRNWRRLHWKDRRYLRRRIAAKLGHWRRKARMGPLGPLQRDKLRRLEEENQILRELLGGKKRSHAEVLSSLRAVAAVVNNLTRRKENGTLRHGDRTRLRDMTQALKRLQRELEIVKIAEGRTCV